MSISISTTARNAAGAAITTLLNQGSLNPAGYIEIRTGTKPLSPQTAATGILLAILNLSNPAFSSFLNGQAYALPIATDPDVAANGIAGWFRIYNGDNNAIIDGTVSETGGGGDLEIDNINFVEGGSLAIVELKALMPQ